MPTSLHLRSRLRRLLLLSLLAAATTACAVTPGEFLSGPVVSVTPARGPVIIPGVTPPLATETPVAEPPVGETPVGETPAAEATMPQRTPVRLKALAPTETPTPLPPTATPVEPSPTPTPAETPAPAETPTETPTATPAEAEATASPTPIPLAVEEPARHPSLENTLNILIVGSDERSAGSPWRSDVVMIAAVDFSSRQVGVISFPRDLWVRIPTVGENRINTATFFGELDNYKDGGGIGLLRTTIGQNFGIRIDHYIKLNFDSFVDVVDALNGITVKVDCPIAGEFPREPGSSQLVWRTLQPGDYEMDGLFALRYVRERKSTSDVDRTRRQQRVLIAMRNRAREINIIPRLPALYDALRATIETDLGLTDIIALARLGILIDPEDAHGLTIGFRETTSHTTASGARVLLPDMAAINRDLLALFEQPSILKNPDKPASCR